jgi:hypothetical protein
MGSRIFQFKKRVALKKMIFFPVHTALETKLFSLMIQFSEVSSHQFGFFNSIFSGIATTTLNVKWRLFQEWRSQGRLRVGNYRERCRPYQLSKKVFIIVFIYFINVFVAKLGTAATGKFLSGKRERGFHGCQI